MGASTIRGDPRKLVGILNNPLYRGVLVWGRREWRKNPDSDRRERRYRLRDKAEWIEVDMPDLHIVDENLAARVRAEIDGRGRHNAKPSNRLKHLLSGLIRCGDCGSSFTMAGKDYYSCARNRERGTCGNSASVRVAAVEDAVLSALQTELLTPDLVRLFAEEFQREVERLTSRRDEAEVETRRSLAEVETEIGNLAQQFLAGAVSPTLAAMLADRKEEKARLQNRLATRAPISSTVVAHPTLVATYERKVAELRATLNNDVTRADAIEALRRLVGSVTLHVDEHGGRSLDVEALSPASSSSPNAERPRRRAGKRSVEVVAGTGSDLCRIRVALPARSAAGRNL